MWLITCCIKCKWEKGIFQYTHTHSAHKPCIFSSAKVISYQGRDRFNLALQLQRYNSCTEHRLWRAEFSASRLMRCKLNSPGRKMHWDCFLCQVSKMISCVRSRNKTQKKNGTCLLLLQNLYGEFLPSLMYFLFTNEFVSLLIHVLNVGCGPTYRCQRAFCQCCTWNFILILVIYYRFLPALNQP